MAEKHCELQQDSNSYRQSTRRARWPLNHQHGHSKIKINKLHFSNKSRAWVKFDLLTMACSILLSMAPWLDPEELKAK